MYWIFVYSFYLILILGILPACQTNASKKNLDPKPDSQLAFSAQPKSIDTLSEVEKIPGLYGNEETNFRKTNKKLYVSLEEGLIEPEAVYRLKLNTQNWKKFPEAIFQFVHLEELYLTDNFLTSIPETLPQKLPKLKVLALGNNQIQTLPPNISQLADLESLDISYNLLTKLPNGFEKLQKLQSLNIIGNKFSQFPKVIFALQQLKHLFVKGIRLDKFPEELGQLRQLTRLTLDNCHLQIFPEVLLKLNLLERLVLAHNQIKQIPTEIKDLLRLEYLNLSHNQLSNSTESLAQLKKLLHLNLNHNPIVELSSEIYTNLRQLKALNLAGTQLRSLSINIGKMTELVWLALNHTAIQEIPASLSECKRIQHIYLGHNPQLDLEQAFEQLVKLPKLNTLEMVNLKGENKPIQLPESIAQLQYLRKLNMRSNILMNPENEITKLARLPRLEALNLSLCGIQKAYPALENMRSLKLLGLDIRNMNQYEVQKLPNLLAPHTFIMDGSEYFDYRL